MLWNSIPSQLAGENKKIVYDLIKEGARARKYEKLLLWLIDCGLVHKISRVQKLTLLLQSYEDLKAFKLFVLDVGLLGCKVGVSVQVLLQGNDLLIEFKGGLTEQYVFQQLVNIEDMSLHIIPMIRILVR